MWRRRSTRVALATPRTETMSKASAVAEAGTIADVSAVTGTPAGGGGRRVPTKTVTTFKVYIKRLKTHDWGTLWPYNYCIVYYPPT